jgi:hypothetical protein
MALPPKTATTTAMIKIAGMFLLISIRSVEMRDMITSI